MAQGAARDRQTHKSLSYDRSGLGFSDIAKNSHSTVIVAKELGALLKAAKVQPPYIMVGHSIGGFNIRLFTEENMGNVVGMVFVDPSLEGMESMMKSPIVKIQLKLLYPVAKYAYATGLIRILSTVNPRVMVPYATQSAVSRAGADSLRVIVTAEKEETMRSSDYDAVRKANNFGDIPITVLTAKDTLDSAPAAASGWLQWSKDLAKTSSTGKQITINHSSHYIQIDQPQIVIDSILKML